MNDFVKKIFDKIEEFKTWNARVESEKTKYQELKTKNDFIENGYSERENALTEKEKDITKREKQIEDSIDRTRLKLETSIDEINEQIRLGQIEDSNLSQEMERKQGIIKDLQKDIERIRDEKKKEERDYKLLREENISVKSKNEEMDRKNRELDREFEIVADNLRSKQLEIKDIGKREQDLKLYETRIQRYYDEAGIKIKI